jgi:iron complex transport system ATP-binding protein
VSAPARGPALAATGLEVRVGDRLLLRGVDLRVEAGEVLALVGPNGAGKSTLLAALAGDLPAAAGSVEVHGRPVRDWRLRDLSRERSVTTQEHRLAFPFTVHEVVAMGRAPWRGRPEEDDDDRAIAEAMGRTATSGLAAQTFPTLSGGEKARTAFARTLAQRAGIWLLDEPTAALDLGHADDLLAGVRQAALDGVAAVVVLHDLSLAAAWADRVLLLDAGEVVADGPPAAVLTAGRLSAVYGHPVEVLAHPVTGDLLVLPDRTAHALLEEHPA